MPPCAPESARPVGVRVAPSASLSLHELTTRMLKIFSSTEDPRREFRSLSNHKGRLGDPFCREVPLGDLRNIIWATKCREQKGLDGVFLRASFFCTLALLHLTYDCHPLKKKKRQFLKIEFSQLRRISMRGAELSPYS